LPEGGEVRVDGRSVTGLPPHRRPIGWVPQDGALFPHLTVRDNVAFGLGGRRGRAAADAWLERFGIAALADRRPTALSGGQAQKVALARALAREPRLLLLDEPLAALDVAARADVRRTLRSHLSGFDGATLVVTHDPVDAAALADRVVALDQGEVVQDCTLEQARRAPRTVWLAELLDANAYAGTARGSAVMLADGARLVVPELDAADGSDVLAVITPHAVTLHRQQPAGSARNAWPVVVRELTRVGARVRVHTAGRPPITAEVTPAAAQDLALAPGVSLWASVKATEITVVVL
jgi:molybdate transport system permease protein